MNLELSDEQAAALERELRRIIDDDRYPLSPRIQMLREIRNMIRPEPVREPLPEPKLGRERPDSAVSLPKHYEPPSKGRYRRRP
jgi:hypothetical protein